MMNLDIEKNGKDFKVTDPYSAFVAKKAKSGADIAKCVDSISANMIHAVMGISGEAGELLDSIKKTCIYGKAFDRENVVEELGDLEFYMELLRQTCGITRSETICQNVKKLSRRYASGYSDAEAVARADKAEFNVPRETGAVVDLGSVNDCYDCGWIA